MAKLTLKQLLIITPMSDENKEWALKNIETMGEDEKFRLTQICWDTLSMIYKLKTKSKLEKAIIEAGKRKKELTEQEVKNIKDEMVTEMFKKIDEVKSKDKIVHIRKKLEEK